MAPTDATLACPSCGRQIAAAMGACPHDGTLLRGHEANHPTLPGGGDDPASPSQPTVVGEPDGQPLLRDPMVGTHLGEYRVEELIGAGGMGLVYRGVQPLIGKPVAIKVLRPEISTSEGHLQRLLAEARAVNAARHRGIIDIFSFGKLADGRQYFVMEYLRGKPLDLYIQDHGAIPPQEAVSMLQEVASALHAAHQAGVVHRDLKPNNIFVVEESGGKYVKLLDFGLAKLGLPGATRTPQTQSGIVVGTPEYIAPEQARGEEVGPRTDLYSLGVVAFQMLTGQLPFQGATAMDFVIAHIQQQAPRAKDLMPDLPDELSELVAQLMEKNPEHRPSSADAVRRELRRIGRLLPQDLTFIGPAARGAPADSLEIPTARSQVRAPYELADKLSKAVGPVPALTPKVDVVVPTAAKRPAIWLWAAAGALAVGGAAGAAFALRGKAEPAPPPVVVAPPPPPVAVPVPPPAPPAPAPQPPPAEPEPPATVPASTSAPAGKPHRPPAGSKDARQVLLAKVRQLREAFVTRAKPGADPGRAKAMLDRASSNAQVATTEEARAEVEEQLRVFERFFLRPR